MSLDVYLVHPNLTASTKDADADPQTETVFHSSISHNYTSIAELYDIYKVIWRPEEVGIQVARQLIEPLTKIAQRFNGRWTSRDHLFKFVQAYLDACRQNPDALVKVYQ